MPTHVTRQKSPLALTQEQRDYVMDLRRAVGLDRSDESLAQRMREVGATKVSRRAVASWFAGTHGIRAENLPYLAEALDQDPGAFEDEFRRLGRESRERGTEYEQSGGPRYESVTSSQMAPRNLDANVRRDAQLVPLRRLSLGDGRVKRYWPRVVMVAVPLLGRANTGDRGGADEGDADLTRGELLSLPAFMLAGVPVERLGAVQLSGPYLEDLLSDGDFVLIDHDAQPAHRDLVVVRVEATGELVCKFWWETGSGAAPNGAPAPVVLIPNPDSGYGEPEPFDPDTMTVLGVAVLPLRGPDVAALRVTARPHLVRPARHVQLPADGSRGDPGGRRRAAGQP